MFNSSFVLGSVSSIDIETVNSNGKKEVVPWPKRLCLVHVIRVRTLLRSRCYVLGKGTDSYNHH